MSSRLVICGGPGGSGSSTAAAGLADALAEHGERVAVVSLDARFGASSLTTQPGCVALEIDVAPPEGLARATAAWRVDPLVAEVLCADLARAGLWHLWRLPHLLAEYDRVVVDAGSNLARLLLAPHQLRWYAAELGPLHGGWLRAARPVTALAMGPSALGLVGADQVRELNARAEQLTDLLTDAHTAVVLTSGTGDRAADKVHHFLSAMTLVGANVGAVIDRTGALTGTSLADQLDAQSIPIRMDVPSDSPTRPGASGPSRPEIVGDPHGEDVVTWRMPLPFNTARDLDIEQHGLRLLISVHGHRRVFALPSLLERHVAHNATITDGILEVALHVPSPTAQRKTSRE